MFFKHVKKSLSVYHKRSHILTTIFASCSVIFIFRGSVWTKGTLDVVYAGISGTRVIKVSVQGATRPKGAGHWCLG